MAPYWRAFGPLASSCLAQTKTTLRRAPSGRKFHIRNDQQGTVELQTATCGVMLPLSTAPEKTLKFF